MDTIFSRMASPVGTLTLAARNAALVAVLWSDERAGRMRLNDMRADDHDPTLAAARAQLTAYFAGQRRDFDLPLVFGGTAFQRRVWSALLTIPFGETRTYADIARRIGRPKAVRAVGAANGRNPLSIVVPCHRVIGARGALTGFAGGLAAKRHLLTLEACHGPAGVAYSGRGLGQALCAAIERGENNETLAKRRPGSEQ